MKQINKMKCAILCATLVFTAHLASSHQAGAQQQDGAAQRGEAWRQAITTVLDAEISGESAKRNLNEISRHHRMRGSRGFVAAAEHIVSQLRAYGLENAEIISLPADGKIMYGTQRSRRGWNVDYAELWEVENNGSGETRQTRRLGHWEAMPLSVAQGSESAEVLAELIDVGDGTSETDYEGKDVAGKIVLAAMQPGPVADLAVARYGAVGVLSYAQNQVTAWWKDDDTLVRWGHLSDDSDYSTFAFMVSLKEARALQARLASGETIELAAVVKAGYSPSAYNIASATIEGADPDLDDEAIGFTCHLDHPSPGANDNASGCVAILEVARTLNTLIAQGTIPRPARSIRFFWPPEIEGSIALLNARPDIAEALKAVIHMDMVGGGPETKSVFRVSRSPRSLPSFSGDISRFVTELANDQTLAFASGEDVATPLVSIEGGKEPLLAQFEELSMGSDHQVFADSSFAIPYIYLHDWPDRYIHTNRDIPANIDPTKLKRAAFIGAASALFLADLDEDWGADIALDLIGRHSWARTAVLQEHLSLLSDETEINNVVRQHWRNERALVRSVSKFTPLEPAQVQAAYRRITGQQAALGTVPLETTFEADEAAIVYIRADAPKGPMSGFGYSYLSDKLGAERASALRLPGHAATWGKSHAYDYEALNFVDGRRSVTGVRDALAAEFGPVPLEFVVEYLGALAEIGILEQK